MPRRDLLSSSALASSYQFEVFVASFVRVRVEVRSPAYLVVERSVSGLVLEVVVVELAVMAVDLRWRLGFRSLSPSVEE